MVHRIEWDKHTATEVDKGKNFLCDRRFVFGASVLVLLFPYSLYLFSYHFVFHFKFMEFIRDLKGEQLVLIYQDMEN